jgi:phosphatidylserine decarboxylase
MKRAASPFSIRWEQFRQARLIHGSLWKMLVALAGIRLARLPIPSRRLRLWIYRGIYRKKYPPGLDENEAEMPLASYKSLNAMFTRGIKPQFRPIPAGTPQFLCPCDGVVQDVGRVEQGTLLTVKGIKYTLESLLPHTDTARFEGGHFLIVYLSPIHCHRVFSPHDGQLEQASHVPGFRLLVSPPYQRAEYPVYTLNERMIIGLTTELGPCLVVMVAGWGVGNITFPLAPEFRTRRKVAATRTWSPPASVQRGEWIATFELGSTAILFAPPAAVGYETLPLVSPGMEVKYGQPVFTYADPGNGDGACQTAAALAAGSVET